MPSIFRRLRNHSSNHNNDLFYSAVSIAQLKEFCQQAGLSGSRDLQIIDAMLPLDKQQDDVTVLEVGAGYGRVSDWLMQRYPNIKLDVLERNQSLYQALQVKYLANQNIRPMHKNIVEYVPAPKRYDRIFMLWASLCEFSPPEQRLLIKKLISALKQDGILIIDLPPANSHILTSTHATRITVNLPELPTWRGNLITPEKLQRYIADFGASKQQIQSLSYATDSKLERILFFYHNSACINCSVEDFSVGKTGLDILMQPLKKLLSVGNRSREVV